MSEFVLHPMLAADCAPVGALELCLVLLMNDRRFPWFVLVPRVERASEIYDLTAAQRATLIEESARFAKGIMDLHKGDKCNIAALGNKVPQLHLHHIVRFKTDEAWPGPIWRVGKTEPYSPTDLAGTVSRVRAALPFLH